MSKKVNISVIMAEYNTDTDTLRTAIHSILNQTYRNFEFIIIDDGGKNDLKALISEFDDNRIRVVSNTGNKGLIYSLNRAIRCAKGEYLVRMDTDDIARPDRIEILYDFIASHCEYAVVGSRADEFSETGYTGTLGLPGEVTNSSIMQSRAIIHPSVIMRKRDIETVGGYPNYKRAEDFAMWCELLLAGYKLYVLDDVLLEYRVHTDDYIKRSLRHRKGEIKAKLHYYRRLNARPAQYFYIVKSIIAGILPVSVVITYRKAIMSKTNSKKDK